MRRAVMKRGKAVADENLQDTSVKTISEHLINLCQEAGWYGEVKVHYSMLKDAANCIEEEGRRIEALQQHVGELEGDNEALTKHLDNCVQDKLEEINAEAEAYDRDATNTLVKICEACPAFDWSDYPEGLTTQDAYDFLMEDQATQEDQVNRLKQRVGELQASLINAVSALCSLRKNYEDRSLGIWSDVDRFIREGNQALHQEPGEGGGGGVDVQTGLIEDAEPISNPKVDRRFSKQLNDECPHGCKDGWIIDSRPEYGMPGPRVDHHRPCPIHGTGRKGGEDE